MKKVLIICAHPDDAELYAGGFICKYGGKCKIDVLVVTDGRMGSENEKNETVKIRRKEAENAAKFGSFNVDFLEYVDGEVENNIKLRNDIIRKIRTSKPQVILTHKDNDYHPDHRYVSKAVQDSLIAIYCPKYVPEVPAIDYIPLVLFFWNPFELPYSFKNDICIEITSVINQKKMLLLCHKSQFSDDDFLYSEVFGKGKTIYNELHGKAKINIGNENRTDGVAEAFEICQYITPEQFEMRINELKDLLSK